MLIYKATNPLTNKSYIGQTVKTLSQRAAEHKHKALCENDTSNKFHNAIRKYGYDIFEWSILEESETWDYDTLDEREKYYIELYDSVNNGYNTLYGGQGKSRIDGVIMAELCGSKPFYAFTTQGKLIGEFINKKQFSEKYDIPISRICEMVQNKTLSSKGIIIIDKEQYNIDLLNTRLKHCMKKIPFMAICKENGKESGPYTNIEECKRLLNLPKNCHITEVLKGVRKSSNGYIFKYVD